MVYMEKKRATTLQATYQALKRMVEDKRDLRLYIDKKGTLDGFNKQGVKFAKPL